ncbi:MAG: hypothetical protein H5U06_06275 [Candidatus Aminicenantes bacterium]|nr:hypothetical protein [Candidatus Aminicenantes bacterium]
MAIISNKKTIFLVCIFSFTIIVFLSAFLNLLLAVFPVNYELGHDEAEHLHVAYLLEQGQRPYLDFIENHPTLFNHYLKWLWKFFKLHTVREWAFAARLTIFFHIVLMFLIFFIWLSGLIKPKPNKLFITFCFLLSFSFIGFYHGQLEFMWQIRPDWISYGYSFLGFYLFYLYLRHRVQDKHRLPSAIYLVIGAAFVGLGNAILPKGFTIILGITMGLLLLTFTRQINRDLIFSKKVINGSILFGILVFIFFILFANLDCKLSNVDLISWAKANFLLNSSKHLPLTNADNNPITSLSAIFSLNLTLILVLSTWLFVKISSRQTDEGSNTEKQLLVLSTSVIIINVSMTGFGNGLSWPHYFIPSVFAALTIYIILILDLISFKRALRLKKANFPEKYFFILAIVIIFSVLSKQPMGLYSGIINRQANLSDSLVMKNNDYLNESILPNNFIYFTPKPTEMPIRARHAGYYFMLVIDKKIWNDCYNLGLAPEPESHLKHLFDTNPPDILAFNGMVKLYEYVVFAYAVQEVNLTWLFDEVDKRYVLMKNRQRQIFVREDLTELMTSKGWEKVSK